MRTSAASPFDWTQRQKTAWLRRYGCFELNDDKTILIAARDLASRRFRLTVVCIGPKKHYRRDGSCRHTDSFRARLKPWYRTRCAVVPFGRAP